MILALRELYEKRTFARNLEQEEISDKVEIHRKLCLKVIRSD